VLTRARQFSLFWATRILSINLHSISLRSILILASHLHVGLLSSLFPSGFPIKTLYASLSYACCMLCTSFLLDLIILIIVSEEYKLWSFSLRNFLQLNVVSSILGPNIILSALFSNVIRLCFVFNMRPSFTSIQNCRQNCSFYVRQELNFLHYLKEVRASARSEGKYGKKRNEGHSCPEQLR
jgi:hypothetical protein